ncbi:MAG: hypothetical protein LLG02_12795 [Pelosinus sp.]|nr:hypothetical protein [Pelosinus sp.]
MKKKSYAANRSAMIKFVLMSRKFPVNHKKNVCKLLNAAISYTAYAITACINYARIAVMNTTTINTRACALNAAIRN